MKGLKKFLLVFLTLTLAFCLFACGGGSDPCKTHTDEDNDGKCDKCSETVEAQPSAKDVALVKEGVANFQIVCSNELSTMATSKVGKMKTTFAGLGIDVDRVLDNEDNVKDCEILIGNVTSRGDKYFVDGHDYGAEGYVIKIIDSKIIINAGSDDMLILAIDKFLDDIIEIDDGEKDFENLVMLASQQVEKIQDDYKITSLSVDGKDMKGYTLAVNKDNEYHMEAAKLIQETMYEDAGYWFEIVDLDKANDTSIIIKTVAKGAVEGGFKISASPQKQLLIECGYDNMIKSATEYFIVDNIEVLRGDVDLKGTVYTKDISVVYYKDFGAVGNGVTDDFFAIKAAHDFANISGQTVKAERGKTYYIHETRDDKGTANNIVIKTNVDWCNAKFIIDDYDISAEKGSTDARRGKNIFNIASDYANTEITDQNILNGLAGIGEGTTKLNLKLGYPALITIYNDNHLVYRRYGYSQQDGEPQSEVLLIDAEGNIDESTPFMFDYEVVTSVKVHRLDVEPITVKNGTVTTMASHVFLSDKATAYITRGMGVSRPGTVIENVKHYVEGELSWTDEDKAAGRKGSFYKGFFTATGTNDVLFKNCVLTGRRAYSHSSYDFKAEYVNKVRLVGCTQSNFYLRLKDDGTTEPACDIKFDSNGVPTVTPHSGDDVYLSMSPNPEGPYQFCWGIAGTNYSKNIEYINSVLSRYDAHCGVLNGKVVGTTINTFALVGKGDFLIENSTWISAVNVSDDRDSVITLRSDYGSPWNGTITIRDTKATAPDKSDFYLVEHSYRNWDYGYTRHFPNIVVDNLELTNTDTVKYMYDSPAWITRENTIHKETVEAKRVEGSSVYYEFNGPYENVSPVVPPEFFKVINNKSGENYEFEYYAKLSFFCNTKFEVDTNGDAQPDKSYYQNKVYDGPIE